MDTSKLPLKDFPFFQQNTPALRADIAGLSGYPDISGTVLFYRTVKGIVMIWSISGLPKRTGCESSVFAFHIHDGTNCGDEIGEHYNPHGCPHPQHAGDLPPLFANDGYAWGAVLTTEEGLRNMGLFRNGWDTITIYLDGIVDEETEAALTQSVTAIARRAEGSRVYNYMESARENARTQLQLMLLMGAITIVFFAVAAGMIVSAVTRQLQADGKRIGMLRAVGAEEKTILRCYSGQVFLSLGLGMVSSILVMAVLFTSSIMNVPARYYPSGIATILVFSLACLGLCQFMLRRRVRQITKQSIIDNIREL